MVSQGIDRPRALSNFELPSDPVEAAVVIPAAGCCVCPQIRAINQQLNERDRLSVVWNGPRPIGHDCLSTVISMPRVAWLEFDQRIGAARARNAGAAWFGSEFRLIAFADADDVVVPDWLRAIKYGVLADGIDVAGGPLLVRRRGATALVVPGADFWHRQAIYGCSCAVSRPAWERLGGFRSDVGTCEDTDLAWRAGEEGLRVEILDTAKVVYQLRNTWGEMGQRYWWGHSSIRLLRAHGLPLRHHWPTLLGLIHNYRRTGFARNCVLAGAAQFFGQCVAVTHRTDRR